METATIVAEVAQRVADRITEAGRTPAEVAAAVGVHTNLIELPAHLSVGAFVQLSLELGTTPAALLGGAQ